MHFCDEVKVTFIAGSGGKGCVSFLREKYVPRGGPDGGDGGNGGSIYLEADANRNTLSEFNTYKVFRAKNGEAGMGKKMHGKNAEDLILKVPPGTMAIDPQNKNVLADLKETKEKFCIARGGKGGFGNAHFSTSTRQAPTFAELGEPGEKKEIILELKLVADCGIIGLPSVGKSSFIARVSAARPKIADYPFTTLVPNLGVCYLSSFGGEPHESFVVCDIPGLIEGAHKGKGLGIEFLKHIMRNRVLLHLLDAGSENLAKDYKTILAELKSFDESLPQKPQIIAINKIDLLDEENRNRQKKSLLNAFPELKDKLFLISCATGEGLKDCVMAIYKILKKIPKETPDELLNKPEEEYKIFRPEEQDTHSFTVSLVSELKDKKQFEVKGRRIEQIVVMSDFRNPEAVSRVYDVMQKMGVQNELRHQGAKENDEIKIGKQIVIFHEE